MKGTTDGKFEEYPDTPPWTMFFDGPLYQKYDEFMKTKDFSKILLNTKLRLANSHGPEVISSNNSIGDAHWEKEQDEDPTGNTYPYVSEEYYRRVKEDQKRRTRKTRAFILLGLVVMAALAFGTALVIHYFFIPSLEERNPKNMVNVSFAVNTSSSNSSDIDQTTPLSDDISNLLDTMQGDDHHHPHHHDHDHEHILNPSGKIFEDHFTTTTPFPPESTSEFTSKATSRKTATTLATTTRALPKSTTATEYLLNLQPEKTDNFPNAKLQDAQSEMKTELQNDTKQKQYTSTVDLNHMDFFGMDEYYTTTNSTRTVSSTDTFAMNAQRSPASTTSQTVQEAPKPETTYRPEAPTKVTRGSVSETRVNVTTFSKEIPVPADGSTPSFVSTQRSKKETRQTTTYMDNSTYMDWGGYTTYYDETTTATNRVSKEYASETPPISKTLV